PAPTAAPATSQPAPAAAPATGGPTSGTAPPAGQAPSPAASPTAPPPSGASPATAQPAPGTAAPTGQPPGGAAAPTGRAPAGAALGPLVILTPEERVRLGRNFPMQGTVQSPLKRVVPPRLVPAVATLAVVGGMAIWPFLVKTITGLLKKLLAGRLKGRAKKGQ